MNSNSPSEQAIALHRSGRLADAERLYLQVLAGDARNAAARLGYAPQPIVSLGGTDTRFWRRAGVPCFVYGCSPAGMGGIDEAVGAQARAAGLRVEYAGTGTSLRAGACERGDGFTLSRVSGRTTVARRDTSTGNSSLWC